MLGSFNLPSIGSFVVSGDTPKEFLWDLFDQIVFGSNRTINANGAQMVVPNDTECEQDYQERLEARESMTQEWQEAHSQYFTGKIGGPASEYAASIIPPMLYFEFHSMALLGSLIEQLGQSSRANLMKTNIARSTHGVNTPEFHQAISEIKAHDYPFGDLEPLSLINYMILKGALVIRNSGGIPLLTSDDAAKLKQRRADEMSKLLDLEKNAALASKQRAKEASLKKNKRK